MPEALLRLEGTNICTGLSAGCDLHVQLLFFHATIVYLFLIELLLVVKNGWFYLINVFFIVVTVSYFTLSPLLFFWVICKKSSSSISQNSLTFWYCLFQVFFEHWPWHECNAVLFVCWRLSDDEIRRAAEGSWWTCFIAQEDTQPHSRRNLRPKTISRNYQVCIGFIRIFASFDF